MNLSTHGALEGLLNLDASSSAQALPGGLLITSESCNRNFMDAPEASIALQSADSLGNLTKRERDIFFQGFLLGVAWRDENPRHHQTLLPQTVQNAVTGEQVLAAQLEDFKRRWIESIQAITGAYMMHHEPYSVLEQNRKHLQLISALGAAGQLQGQDLWSTSMQTKADINALKVNSLLLSLNNSTSLK